MTDTAPTRLLARIAYDYWHGLIGLFDCPREIWIAFVIKVLESLRYFSSVLVLMIFLTEDMGLDDLTAGTIFGFFSASMSFFMLFVGFVADSMGIKKALFFGLVIALAGRASITFTTSPWIVYPGLFFLFVGFAYMIPLLAAAVKLFSTRTAQKFAFSWYYVVMNVGSLLAGLSLDWLRATFTEVTTLSVAGAALTIRPIQMIFFVAIVATLVSMVLVVFCIRTKIPVKEDDPGEETRKVEQSTASTGKTGLPIGIGRVDRARRDVPGGALHRRGRLLAPRLRLHRLRHTQGEGGQLHGLLQGAHVLRQGGCRSAERALAHAPLLRDGLPQHGTHVDHRGRLHHDLADHPLPGKAVAGRGRTKEEGLTPGSGTC
jgi:hypothetical protein